MGAFHCNRVAGNLGADRAVDIEAADTAAGSLAGSLADKSAGTEAGHTEAADIEAADIEAEHTAIVGIGAAGPGRTRQVRAYRLHASNWAFLCAKRACRQSCHWQQAGPSLTDPHADY